MTRTLLLKIHLYIGLWLGLVVTTIALSGTALVYFYPLDRLLNPELLTVRPAGGAPSFDAVIASASAHRPGADGPTRIQIPPQPDMPYILAFNEGGRQVEVMVDPGTLAVLGSRYTDEAFVWQLFSLHSELLAGETGYLIVALTGAALLLASLTGIYLWWPRGGRWRQALRFKWSRNARKLTFDLHRVGGAYAAVIMVILAFTGIYLMYPDVVGAPVKALAGDGSPPAAAGPSPERCDGPTTADQAVAIAKRAFPAARLTTLYPPGGKHAVFRVNLHQSGEWQYDYGSTVVRVAADCPRLVSIADATTARGEEAVQNALLPWHSGQAFGATGRAVVFISGLVLTALVVTGVMIWLQRRAQGRRRLRESGKRPPVLERVDQGA